MRSDGWEIQVFVFVEEKDSRYIDARRGRYGHFGRIQE